jgi:hypothetical protein
VLFFLVKSTLVGTLRSLYIVVTVQAYVVPFSVT